MKKLILLAFSTFLFDQSFASSISEEDNVEQPKALTYSEGEKAAETEEIDVSPPLKTIAEPNVGVQLPSTKNMQIGFLVPPFRINESPFLGTEYKYLSSKSRRERLLK